MVWCYKDFYIKFWKKINFKSFTFRLILKFNLYLIFFFRFYLTLKLGVKIVHSIFNINWGRRYFSRCKYSSVAIGVFIVAEVFVHFNKIKLYLYSIHIIEKIHIISMYRYYENSFSVQNCLRLFENYIIKALEIVIFGIKYKGYFLYILASDKHR